MRSERLYLGLVARVALPLLLDFSIGETMNRVDFPMGSFLVALNFAATKLDYHSPVCCRNKWVLFFINQPISDPMT